MLAIILFFSLAFMMQAGFCCLEAGMVRSKNSINIAVKNILDFHIGIILFFSISYGLMYGDTYLGLIGTSHFFTNFSSKEYPQLVFQMVFCTTAVTIISGSISERMRIKAYVLISIITVLVLYPLYGHWVWNSKGWLKELGYVDFAGSSVVHLCGGLLALSAAVITGPRIGKYDKKGVARDISGHNQILAILGLLILWFGWIGFNGGSCSNLEEQLPLVITTTFTAGAAGGLFPMVWSLILNRKLKLRDLLAGSLSGLIAITACCHAVDFLRAAFIGLSASIICIKAAYFIERKGVDDPVDAIAVHGVGGAWGIVMTGVLGKPELLNTGLTFYQQLLVQFSGLAISVIWFFGCSFIIFKVLNRWSSFRVSKEEEALGLNISEHDARSDLQDLLKGMKEHKEKGIFEKLEIDPFTVPGEIAEAYNEVIERVNYESGKVKAANNQLADANELLRLKQEQLVQAQKMEAIGHLAAGIAHEINTPIQFIGNNINFMKDAFIDLNQIIEALKNSSQNQEEIIEKSEYEFYKEEIPASIQDSLEGIVRISTIVKAMKEYSQPGSGNKKECDVNKLIQSTLVIARNEWAQRAEIKLNLTENLPLLPLLPGEFNQVILNILVNACDVIKEKYNGTHKGEILVETRKNKNNVLIEIKDNGPGIPKHIQSKIFDPFFTTKAVGKGTGQGLALAHKIIVDLHGGEITVDSEEGLGTAFKISLPIDDAN